MDSNPHPRAFMTQFNISNTMTRLCILTVLVTPLLAAPITSQPPPYLSKTPTILHDQDLILPNQPSSLYKRCGSAPCPVPTRDSVASFIPSTAGPSVPQSQSALQSSGPGHFFDSLLTPPSQRSVPVVEGAEVSTEDCEDGTERSQHAGGRVDEGDVFASF
ncbi:hypothetical protein BDZ85DRAFT_283990 [Elsinoe ampelina]|uniref:Uncharacterized protein n=1 Tax=Elsinoe ampelina TaxID=302913 RepID=A0A6A6G6R8_9PEZI|nr:hypothetical protein BDZ85DRAFT_283990 [Elsinoe ampelina]